MKEYSAKYFSKTAKILERVNPDNNIVIQFFQRKNNAILAGINEVLEMLKKETDVSKYSIKYLDEGSKINEGDIVLELEGPYQIFGEYEGIIDGILSRATSLASNAAKVIEAAGGRDVIFMGDRSDHYSNQTRDGKYIALGGIKTQVTDAHVKEHDGKAVGTIPHVLIQTFEGDIVKALTAYTKTFPDEDLVALVDYNNNVITDSIKAYKAFPEKLKAVRVDTSIAISDAMFLNDEEYGVTPNMIFSLRNALDVVGATEVKIIVSSGFDVEKIKKFKKEGVPVDIYGIGASLLKINNTFTGDAVKINGLVSAKVGRGYKNTDLLNKL